MPFRFERLRRAELDIADLASELAAYAESIEADPKRLAAAEDRLALLDRLSRKYGANETEMLEFHEQAEQELEPDTEGSREAGRGVA